MKKTPPTRVREKRVRGYSVYHYRYDDIASELFETRKLAEDKLRELAYHSNPEVMRDVLKNYTVIQCTITYKLPTQVQRKRGKGTV